VTTFETEFDLGQEVWQVGRKTHNERVTCPTCEGVGKVTVTGADSIDFETYCPHPECRGRGSFTVRHWDLYEIRGNAHIGSIEVRAFDTALAPSYRDRAYEERYMIDTTGIGSGTVYTLADGEWTHTKLFGTQAEAEAFCAAENPALRAETEQVPA